MRGQILVYSADVNAGIITGEDKKKYPFNAANWQTKDYNPANDLKVIFSPVNGKAENVEMVNRKPI